MAEIAVLILNYNGRAHLESFLPSILQHSPNAEIIVGDNGSTDDSVSVIQKKFPSVKLIRLDRNYGYAGGYNRLIDEVDQEYLVLVNSDVEVTTGWLSPLAEMLDKNADVAAVQPKILSYSNRHLFEYAGAGGGYMDKFGFPFCRGRILTAIEEDTGQYDKDVAVFWASGACFMVRRSVFIEVGGFDESFFAHMEEIDLNWRIQNSGSLVMFSGKSHVYHLGGGTLAYDNPRKTYLNFRNSWIMLIKNLTEYNRAAVFCQRYLLDLVSILYFLIQFKAPSALAVLKAHFYILSNSIKLKKLKTAKLSSAKNSSKILPNNFSIVWQFYVNKKRNFSDLIPD